jgi:hypothetical protein
VVVSAALVYQKSVKAIEMLGERSIVIGPPKPGPDLTTLLHPSLCLSGVNIAASMSVLSVQCPAWPVLCVKAVCVNLADNGNKFTLLPNPA